MSEAACRLDWYLAHGFIGAAAHRAGLRFAGLFRRAVEPQRLTQLYAERVDAGPGGIGEGRAFAARELRQAIRRLAAEEAAAVTAVAGLDEYAGPGRTRALKSGLEVLARHWGLPS
ncbi:MAG: hypothetical protein KIT20_06745 [Alphaproteobacteria bacterium]|nr:hypothetical protein [Alphaproteobacteria bacterium]